MTWIAYIGFGLGALCLIAAIGIWWAMGEAYEKRDEEDRRQ